MEEKYLSVIQEFRTEADNHYMADIMPMVKRCYQIYNSDADYYEQMFPRLSKASKLVSTDVADTIEWALPSLMKMFFSSDQVIVISGVTEEDDERAELMTELINWQLTRKNNFYIVAYNWFKDALITGVGIVKCYWERLEREETVEREISLDAYQNLVNAGVQFYSVERGNSPTMVMVSYPKRILEKNQPIVENVLASEFRFLPGYKTLAECPFVAQRKRVSISYLKQKEAQGYYSNVDDAVDSAGQQFYSDDELEQEIYDDTFTTGRGDRFDRPNREVEIWECYVDLDMDEDGILEKWIITLLGDTPLRAERNMFGRHPFFDISPTKDPHRIWVKHSYADQIGHIQDIKTAMTKNMQINIALSNDPKIILSEDAINIDDYTQGRLVIRKKPGFSMADVAMPMPVVPLHPWTFQYLEYLEGQKENRTGITRYNQGRDASSLNKTATGISAIMSASNQRLELIARQFSETGIRELYRFLISLNQLFYDEAQVVRLANKPMRIYPEDIKGDFDLVINAGMGLSTKESNIMNMQALLNTTISLLNSGVPVVTPQNIYFILKKMVNEMGYKNTGDYVTDPQVLQQQQMLQQATMQMIASMLPPEVQMYLQQGGQMTPEILNLLPPQAQQVLQILLGGMQGGAMGTTGANAQGGAVGSMPGTPQGGTPGNARTDNRQLQGTPPLK